MQTGYTCSSTWISAWINNLQRFQEVISHINLPASLAHEHVSIIVMIFSSFNNKPDFLWYVPVEIPTHVISGPILS